ncbi:MAG: hypothetical protein IJB00_03915 [Akkermansia sp.]|nr:hypothetical protein [Akkermansia sp.]
MKHLSLLKTISLTCGAIALSTAASSCSNVTLPLLKAKQLTESVNPTIYSYNDACSPRVRTCTEAGPLPDNVERALNMWLRKSVIKQVSYAYPQYYIAMINPRTGKQMTWAICSDGQGNMTGILIPRDGVAAWDLPFVGNYKMYVCDSKERKAISDAVMETLADAGYDTYRIDTRKAGGLQSEQYLISKPLTDTEKARIEELRKAEAEATATSEESTDTEDSDTSTEPPAEDVDNIDEGSSDESSDSEEDSSSNDEGSSDEETSSDEESSEDETSEEDSF